VTGGLDGPAVPPADPEGAADVAGEDDAAEGAGGEALGAVDPKVAGLASGPGRMVKVGVVPQAVTIAATRISQAIRGSAIALGQRSTGTAPE
jgi:hypothetical protein